MELYSRRTFLKGALVGIGSVAAFGVAGCASAPQEKDPAAAPAGQAVQAAEPQDLSLIHICKELAGPTPLFSFACS